MVIDSDSHLYETRHVWEDHVETARRRQALSIVDDGLGYSWLCFGDRKIEVLGIHAPGDSSQSGEFRSRLRRGLPPEVPYDAMPRDFWDPGARLTRLDELDIDETILFPNCGIMWERALADDLPATVVNMSAWNSWAVEIVQEGRGRLHPVGHLTLRDLDWFETEVRRLAAGGVRLAMISPGLVDGRRLSHPDHERAWQVLSAEGVAVVFHIAQYPPPFDDAWNEGDPDWSNPVLSSVFMWTAPALALADMALRGVFHRHPGLRVGIVELMSAWLPLFLLTLDGGFAFHESFNGEPLTRMPLRPSEYVQRQVRVASFAFEQPARLARQAGDMFMFGSDYPHPEGLAEPLTDYVAGTGIQPLEAPRLYEENARWLLG